jgi:hypothetical protein
LTATPYISGAKKFLMLSAPLISDKMDEDATLLSTIHFAFGIDLLLKHILVSINPIVALKDCDFRNAVPVL